MVPLPFDKLENLIPLLHERFEELKERGLKDDRMHHILKEGYSRRCMDCYVNDVENPTHLLVLMRIVDFWESPSFLLVQSVFVRKGFRGDEAWDSAVLKTIHAYAEVHQLKHITAASMCNSEGEPTTRLWDKAGFTRSQISYTKNLS